MAEHLLGAQPVTKLEACHAERLRDLVRRYFIHDHVVEQTSATLARSISASGSEELPDGAFGTSVARATTRSAGVAKGSAPRRAGSHREQAPRRRCDDAARGRPEADAIVRPVVFVVCRPVAVRRQVGQGSRCGGRA